MEENIIIQAVIIKKDIMAIIHLSTDINFIKRNTNLVAFSNRIAAVNHA